MDFVLYFSRYTPGMIISISETCSSSGTLRAAAFYICFFKDDISSASFNRAICGGFPDLGDGVLLHHMNTPQGKQPIA